jgi:CheY-like chemotaxis protein
MMLQREKERDTHSCSCSVNKPGYRLIFMDCNMPILDGFDATKRIIEMINQGQIKGP